MMSSRKPRIEIEIDRAGWQRAVPDIAKVCRGAAAAAFAVARRRRSVTASLVLTGDRRIQDLNRHFRGYDKPTNVLAFPSGDAKGPDLGGVIIALETTRREAQAQKKRLQAHAAHLVVHGMLHLLGYDHVTTRAAREMEELERRALARIGLADPYN